MFDAIVGAIAGILIIMSTALVLDEPTEIPLPPPVEMVKEEIIKQATEAGVNVEAALRIAKCESNYNPLAKNPYSSAKGIYQFINSTWAGHCDGDVYNMDSNIACFMKMYNKYPHYWECK